MFFLNQEINPANIKSRIKKQTHNKRTWTLNQKKKKKTWRSPDQKAWTKANTGKWRLTLTREEHRNQNTSTRSQLRENKKPKVQKPQSKPTENQIAKMSSQTPDLWNWNEERENIKPTPPPPLHHPPSPHPSQGQCEIKKDKKKTLTHHQMHKINGRS